MKRVLLNTFFALFAFYSTGANANLGANQYYQKIITILTYSNVPKDARICVYKDVATGSDFASYVRKNNLKYAVGHVSEDNFLRSSCNVVYFPNTAPIVQNTLLMKYPRPILSISNRNYECEVGSAFCLYQRNDKSVSVKINLDTLVRSKVKVDPRVLQMLSK